MKEYHFNYEKALKENGFYTRESFYDISDIEIRLLFLSSLLINAEKPFKNFSYSITKKHDKLIGLCIEALNAEMIKHLNDKNSFKSYVFKEIIDCVVIKICFCHIQSFIHINRLSFKEYGIFFDKNGKIILDVFTTWQELTGVWIPFTSIGQQFALSFKDRINSFRPFMGWEIKKRII